MNKQERIKLILQYFEELFPHAGCELIYQKDYELVIAVMLSAQTTDESVNRVTEKLFFDYPTLVALDAAPLSEIENAIRTIGLFRNKAKNIKGITKKLLENFSGVVPADKNQLMTLPGVGNKSANVIRAEIFHIPEIPVDTHVHRVSKRLNLVKMDDDVFVTEKKLRGLIPKDLYIKSHHQFIHFGRYFCKARAPQCAQCHLRSICKEPNKNL